MGNDDLPDQGRPYAEKNETAWERNPPPGDHPIVKDKGNVSPNKRD